MPLLAKEPGSQKKSTLCSEGVLLGLHPFPLGLLPHPSGVWAFPGICLPVLGCPHGSCCILAGISLSLGNILSVLLLPSGQLTCCFWQFPLKYSFIFI